MTEQATVRRLLDSAAAALAQAGIEASRLEAELLLRHCLGLSRSELFLRPNHLPASAQQTQFNALLRRRCRREPLQYILGSCEFWSFEFLVSPAVLIPRPETEFLIEHSLAVLKKAQCRPQQILDLCTGSGAIAVVLAKELPAAAITASDCSLDALAVARSNILKHGLEDRIQIVCADLLACFRPAPFFDLIVSNPPYIKAGDLSGLQPEVRDWEPHLALSGGASGMKIVEAICAKAADHLRPGGWLFLEIGADLGEETEQALQRTGQYEQVKVAPDWAGRPRAAQARKIWRKNAQSI